MTPSHKAVYMHAHTKTKNHSKSLNVVPQRSKVNQQLSERECIYSIQQVLHLDIIIGIYYRSLKSREKR